VTPFAILSPVAAMNLLLGVTDQSWFDQLAAMSKREHLDEVNFWSPSAKQLHVLRRGEMLLFRLHAPRNVIAGGGFLDRATVLPIGLAWQAFRERNGVTSERELEDRIRKYRRGELSAQFTCILLSEPFFFAPGDEIPAPADFMRPHGPWKSYDATVGTGRRLYEQVCERLARTVYVGRGPAQNALVEARYGTPRVVAPRLGQGGFRIGVLESYQRRCAMSGERTVPVLEAAHVRRYSDGGGHELSNGLLLRSDLHKLFDLGYLAVHPERKIILVSERIREEFRNGRDYYVLRGRPLAVPRDLAAQPDPEALQFHCDTVFRG
ncbi:MAG: HNH endonuclease, partial [Terriglobales bacterium]